MGFPGGPSRHARSATHEGTGAQPAPVSGRFAPNAAAAPGQQNTARVLAHLPEGPTLGAPLRALPTYVEPHAHAPGERSALVRLPVGGIHAVVHGPRGGGV